MFALRASPGPADLLGELGQSHLSCRKELVKAPVDSVTG
jgi:hypothetical protein